MPRRRSPGGCVGGLVTGCLVALAVTVPAPASASVSSSAQASVRVADQQYYWRWSDGSRERHRTFRHSQYRVPERLPTLVVSVLPATPARLVRLQYRDDGRWQTEDVGRTDAAGQVHLHLTPYCPDGRWCDERVDYRARVDGETASVQVTFAP